MEEYRPTCVGRAEDAICSDGVCTGDCKDDLVDCSGDGICEEVGDCPFRNGKYEDTNVCYPSIIDLNVFNQFIDMDLIGDWDYEPGRSDIAWIDKSENSMMATFEMPDVIPSVNGICMNIYAIVDITDLPTFNVRLSSDEDDAVINITDGGWDIETDSGTNSSYYRSGMFTSQLLNVPTSCQEAIREQYSNLRSVSIKVMLGLTTWVSEYGIRVQVGDDHDKSVADSFELAPGNVQCSIACEQGKSPVFMQVHITNAQEYFD
jgi:hypothetical protein